VTRAELRDRMVAEFGEPFTFSYFDRSGFTEVGQILTPWSLVANDKFRREARGFLQREGIALGKPSPAHLKPGAKPVIYKPGRAND
jgi:hypothetical protein